MASKRLRAVNASEGEELEVDMSPMIDMVFLLLLFFLVASTAKTIKMDKKVDVPVASHANIPDDTRGRIVINVYSDKNENGMRYRMADGQTPFSNDTALKDYLKKQADRINGLGLKPRLHLRGDKNVEFKHCRKVIRLASQSGVNEYIFASYSREKK